LDLRKPAYLPIVSVFVSILVKLRPERLCSFSDFFSLRFGFQSALLDRLRAFKFRACFGSLPGDFGFLQTLLLLAFSPLRKRLFQCLALALLAAGAEKMICLLVERKTGFGYCKFHVLEMGAPPKKVAFLGVFSRRPLPGRQVDPILLAFFVSSFVDPRV